MGRPVYRSGAMPWKLGANLCSQMLARISDIAPIVLPVRHNSNDYRTGIVRRSLAPTACAGTEPVHRKKAIPYPGSSRSVQGLRRLYSERECQVRLQAMFMPDSTHALFTEARSVCHPARAPESRVDGPLPGRFPDHLLHLGRCDRGWSSRARILEQRHKTEIQKPVPPACCSLGCDV